MIKENTDNFIRYISKPMIGYRKHFEAAASEAEAKVIAIEGSGCHLQIINEPKTGFSRIRPVFSAGYANQKWTDFLNNYLNDLKNIEKPVLPLWKYVSSLNRDQKELIITILPVAAEINRKGFERDLSIGMALEWTIEVLERELFQSV